jgi:hypothetical protein
MKPVIYVEQFQPQQFQARYTSNLPPRTWIATGISVDEAVRELVFKMHKFRGRFNIVCVN